MTGGPHDRYTVRDEAPKAGELEYLASTRYQATLHRAAETAGTNDAVAWRHQHTALTIDGKRLTWMTLPVRGRRRGR